MSLLQNYSSSYSLTEKTFRDNELRLSRNIYYDANRNNKGRFLNKGRLSSSNFEQHYLLAGAIAKWHVFRPSSLTCRPQVVTLIQLHSWENTVSYIYMYMPTCSILCDWCITETSVYRIIMKLSTRMDQRSGSFRSNLFFSADCWKKHD